MTRIVDIADTYTSATTPTVEGSIAASLENFANNAAYEAKYGSGAAGDTFWDTTLKVQKVHDGTAWRSTERALDNATNSDPTVNDDTTQGYEVLSLWLNTSSGAFFRATDVTTGAAVWQEIAADALLDSHIAATTAHGVSGSVVGTSDAQVITNKDIDGGTASNTSRITIPKAAKATLDGLTRKEGTIVYASDTNTLYADDGTTLQEIGSGGGGLDVFHTDDFELANAFTTGNNATPDAAGTGTMDGAVSDETSSPISDAQSLKYVMGSTSADDFFINGSDIALDEKQTNNWVGANFWYTYNGDDDDIRFFILDQDDAELTTSTEYIKSNTTATRFSTAVYIPDGTTGIRYGFQVVTGNSSKVFIVDDLEASTNPFVYKNLVEITDWQDYTPSTQGLGTPTITHCQWRRVGDSVHIQGTITAGTTTAVEARIDLPSGLTSKSDLPSLGTAQGSVEINAASASNNVFPLIEASSTYLVFGAWDSGRAALSKINGNSMVGSSTAFTFFASVPIEGWSSSSEHVVTPAKSNMTDWTSYTPATTQGFGTVTSANFEYKQVGDSYYIRGKFTSGTVSGVEARIGLPNGKTIKSGDPRKISGVGTLASSSANQNVVLTDGGEAYLKFGIQSGSTGGLAVANGNSIIGSGAAFTFFAHVPIEGLTSEATFLAAVPVQQVAYVYESQTSGTAGGDFNNGADRTRTLNTLDGDTGFISLSSNQFTLNSGKYLIEAHAPAFGVNEHKAKIYNTTDSSTEILGTLAYADSSGGGNNSVVMGTIEISSSKTFELRHRCGTTRATNGLGAACSFGDNEIYSKVKITKLK